MKMGIFSYLGLGNWVRLLSLFLFAVVTRATAASEESFDTLQIGTHVYSNVTVTTKTKSYVFILHSTGMTNLKVTELPADVQRKLGYTAPDTAASASSKIPGTWAKKTMATLHVSPQVKGIEEQVAHAWKEKLIPSDLPIPPMTTGFFVTLGAVALLVYVFFSYCSLLICQKTGAQPGIIIFVPILQMIPLLKAAGMSPLWLIGLFVPILNVVASILWAFKIARARNKSAWIGLFLILPVTNLFAFLYLAFSSAAAAEKDQPRMQLMTLETA